MKWQNLLSEPARLITKRAFFFFFSFLWSLVFVWNINLYLDTHTYTHTHTQGAEKAIIILPLSHSACVEVSHITPIKTAAVN